MEMENGSSHCNLYRSQSDHTVKLMVTHQFLASNLPQLSCQQRMHMPAQHFDDHPKQMLQCLSGGKYKRGSIIILISNLI